MTKTSSIMLKVFVGIVLAITIILGVYYFVSYKAEGNEIADIVNKGNTLMYSGQYEQAISCYEQALEHEENNEQLKSAIIEAYMRLAKDAGISEEAVTYYNNALAYGSNNKTAYWGIADIYEELGEEDTMMEVLRKGYEDTQDSEMFEKVSGIENERARILAEEEAIRQAQEAEEKERMEKEQRISDKLTPLVALFVEKDYDSLKDTLRNEDYIAFSDEVIGDNVYYCGNYDDAGKREGIGIAVYENGYYYYGEFHDNVRSGHGVLMRAAYSDSSSIGSFIFDGQWENDAPNGEGVATSNYYKDRISANDFATKEISGNYKDGLEDGDMVLKGTTKSGSSRTFNYKATDGVAEKSSNDDSGIKGQYIIAQTSNKSENLTSDGSVRGVEGYTEEE